MFESQESTMTMFRARPAVPASPASRRALRASSQAREPQLAVAWESGSATWWSSWKAVTSRVKLGPLRESIQLFRNTPVAPFRFPAKPLAGAVLLHGIFFLSLPFLLRYMPTPIPPENSDLSEAQIIYYRLPSHDPLERLPKITPRGAGGHPGEGSPQIQLPILGSTVPSRRVIVVSQPVRPDNKRQTIYQPATPPDLKIKMDLKLPNVVGGIVALVPKPEIHFNPKILKVLQAKRKESEAVAPTLTSSNAAMPLTPDPAITQPHLAVPVEANSRPVQVQKWDGTVAELSLTVSNASATMPGDSSLAGNFAPAAPTAMNGSESGMPAIGDGSKVVVIGIDAAQAALLNLPPGNRAGEFTIAPGGGGAGTPGGVANGSASGGNGSRGSESGDKSTGVGRGDSGGGGGNAGASGILSVTDNTGGAGGALDPHIIADMVYPVPATLVLRKNALVVSAGPMGGGGINAYGALRCGKIYTVFLSMPGKSWTLEFCQSGKGAAPAVSHSNVIHMEQGLIPPEAEAKFDFKRVAVPFEKLHKPIVLKGSIKEDGTVDGVEIYQSIVATMDEAARVAFGKWKFKPALKEGKAVAIDILVGIPSDPVTKPQ